MEAGIFVAWDARMARWGGEWVCRVVFAKRVENSVTLGLVDATSTRASGMPQYATTKQ